MGYALFKRLFDLGVALVLFISLSPLILVVAIVIRVKMGAPVLFRQMRPGLNGEPFAVLKFRTMLNATDSSGQPLPDAARLTTLGKWLRRLSLDELPQLINVLIGDMSLVGPRPLLLEYLPLYSPEQARRHDVRPGISGWAQVNGRNAINWETRLALDVWYVDHACFSLDMRILLMTVTKVLSRHGVNAPGEATVSKFGGTGCSPTRVMKDQEMNEARTVAVDRWFVFGASGHGKVVVDAIERTGGTIAFIVDDDPAKFGQLFFGYAVVSRDFLLAHRADIDCGVVAVGDNSIRARIVGWLESHHFVFKTLVHPGAMIGRGVSIGKGTVVFAAAVVNSDTRIGEHSIINTASSVDHDCILGDGIHIAPGVRLCGGVSVGDHALLGVGSVVLPGLSIGAGALVAAGAVVNRDVAPTTWVGGVPAQALERSK